MIILDCMVCGKILCDLLSVTELDPVLVRVGLSTYKPVVLCGLVVII